jgi:hypothetical protein
LDFLYVFKKANSLNFAKINWKAPGTRIPTITGVYTYDVVTQAIKTTNAEDAEWSYNFIPSAGGLNWQLNDAGAFFDAISYADIASAIGFFGPGDRGRYTAGAGRNINAGTETNLLAPNSPGFVHIHRVNNNLSVFKEGVTLGPAVDIGPGQTLSATEIKWIPFGNNVVWGILGAGKSLQGKEATLSTLYNTYKT